MIIYNVTISLIDETIHQEWLEWMKNKHIPDVMKTGCFKNAKICQLIADDQITYAIQYLCEDLTKIKQYQDNFAAMMQAEHNKKYKGQFGAFRTILKIIHEA